jgi:LacI family transcriptional regulator
MITLEEVARKARVSVSTVSRALTRPDRVARETREKVLEAAQELGYAPNQLARSLRQRASRTIGLIISDIQVQFHSEVAKGVEDTAMARGYTTILCNSDENGSKEQTYLDLLKGFRVSGIILEPTEGNVAAIEHLVRGGTPVVEVDRISGARGVTSVLSENIKGVTEAVQYLRALGHRRIGFIGSDLRLTSGRERLQGFQNAMRAVGLEWYESWVETATENTDLEGYRAARTVCSGPEGPDALLVASSAMAGGVLRALRELELRVPLDLSVVLFDDPRWASFADPPLTVIAQDAYGLGARAAEIILSSLERGAKKPKRAQQRPQTVRLGTRLIVRDSCRSPDLMSRTQHDASTTLTASGAASGGDHSAAQRTVQGRKK